MSDKRFKADQSVGMCYSRPSDEEKYAGLRIVDKAVAKRNLMLQRNQMFSGAISSGLSFKTQLGPSTVQKRYVKLS